MLSFGFLRRVVFGICLGVLLSSGSVVLGVARVACLSVLGKSLVDIVFEAEVLLINHVYSDW